MKNTGTQSTIELQLELQARAVAKGKKHIEEIEFQIEQMRKAQWGRERELAAVKLRAARETKFAALRAASRK